MTPTRRHTPEFSPEQSEELVRHGTVTIYDAAGKTIRLADVERTLSQSSNTRSLMWQTVVLALFICGAVWRASTWVGDLKRSITDLSDSVDSRMSDRWWGQAEAMGEQKRVQKNPGYASTALSPDEIVQIQNTVRARLAHTSD